MSFLRCLIFKVLCRLRKLFSFVGDLFILPHSEQFVKHFFEFLQNFFSKPFQRSCPPAIRSGPRKPHKYSTFYHFCCGAVIGQLCYITTSVSKCQHLFAKFLTTVRIVLYSRFGLIPRVIFLLIRRVSTPRAPARRLY